MLLGIFVYKNFEIEKKIICNFLDILYIDYLFIVIIYIYIGIFKNGFLYILKFIY